MFRAMHYYPGSFKEPPRHFKLVTSKYVGTKSKSREVIFVGCQIMENGMWVGQSCHHLADKPFSKKLGEVMKNLGIKSVVDLGCGQGQYIKELSMLLGSGNT